jgi:hypothetical protein
MNKRIKQLAEQAGSTHKQNLGVYQFYADELQEFAELIIRECVAICESGTPTQTTSGGAAELIKLKFGILDQKN